MLPIVICLLCSCLHYETPPHDSLPSGYGQRIPRVYVPRRCHGRFFFFSVPDGIHPVTHKITGSKYTNVFRKTCSRLITCVVSIPRRSEFLMGIITAFLLRHRHRPHPLPSYSCPKCLLCTCYPNYHTMLCCVAFNDNVLDPEGFHQVEMI